MCRNLNIRLETFINTAWRYPTSLNYEDLEDVLSGDHRSGMKYYLPQEHLEAEEEYSNERLNTRIQNTPHIYEFDDDGGLTSLIPAKRQILGNLDDLRVRSIGCLLCGLVCYCVDNQVYRTSQSLSDFSKGGPSGSDRCRISFDFDGQGSASAGMGLIKLNNTIRFGRYECTISIGDFSFSLYPLLDQHALSWFGGRQYEEQIDMQLARNWLRTCKDSHKMCAPQPWHTLFQNNVHLRLIDVEDRCLVDSHGDQQFVALSYVWGSVSVFKSTLSNKNKLYEKSGMKHFWHEISVTVQDAMEVTKALGERFLWTDAICIVQDDPVEKEHLIANMDAVYAGAYLTIVAADGEDANSGLPGIRPGTRHPSKQFEYMDGLKMLPSKASIFECILSCPWSKRAWTLQEALLSTRMLLFTSDGIHFSCNSTTWSENLRQLSESSSPPWEFATAPGFEFGAEMAAIPIDSIRSSTGLPEELRETLWSIWTSVMGDMSERKLTYEHDVLFATAGLTNLLEKALHTKFLYGLPVTQLEESLFWSPIEPGSLRRRKGKDDNPFGPSWSWSGWVGEIGWMAGDIDSVDLSAEKINWCKVDHTRPSPVPVENWDQAKDDTSFPYLSISARISRFRISRKESPPQWIKELHPSAWAHVIPEDRERLGVYCISSTVGEEEPVGSIVLDCEDYLIDADEKVTDFIIVGSTSFRQDVGDFADQVFQHVLAVEWYGHYAVRVGHGRILTTLWDSSGWLRKQVVLG